MTVTLKDVNERDLWAVRLEPRRERWSRGGAAARS
jgi:hypothetical protein